MTPPELDAETKARIEAEEAYRAEVRAKAEAQATGKTAAAKPNVPSETDEQYRERVRQGFAAKGSSYLYEAIRGQTPERQQFAQAEATRIEAERRAKMTPEELKRENRSQVIGGLLALGSLFVIPLLIYWWYSRPPIPASPAQQAAQAAAAAEQAEKDHFGAFGTTCTDLVTKNLKAPSTADVSNYYTDKDGGNLQGSFASGYTWHGYVDSENSFGAKIRTQFTCTEAPNDTMVHVNFDN